jgi:hypothetical protein
MLHRSFDRFLRFGFLGSMLLGLSIKVPAAELDLKQLPPGVFLQKRIELPSDQLEAIGRKLGGGISKLTNAFLHVHGRSIQVNEIVAADEASTVRIHATLSKTKAAPYCLRKGTMVIEYVGKDIDESLAIKTSYELGLVPKPARVNYRISAELATIDRADYMACNLLFNRLLSLGGTDGSGAPAPESIASLTNRFQFGRCLIMRAPSLNTAGAAAEYQFEPAPVHKEDKGSVVRCEFDQLPVRYGVPYVTVSLEVPVSDTGLLNILSKPGPELTAATPHWPVADPKIKALAEEITHGKPGADAKVKAILEWLTPGRNIKFSGETGSRWGTQKVLQQGFGHCWDFSDCFVTLSRAAGVPSRQVAGWFYGSSGHVWAEYYREGHGWQQVDATGGGDLRCGIYHVAYFTTEDGEMPILYLSMPKIEAK